MTMHHDSYIIYMDQSNWQYTLKERLRARKPWIIPSLFDSLENRKLLSYTYYRYWYWWMESFETRAHPFFVYLQIVRRATEPVAIGLVFSSFFLPAYILEVKIRCTPIDYIYNTTCSSSNQRGIFLIFKQVEHILCQCRSIRSKTTFIYLNAAKGTCYVALYVWPYMGH